ncbi:MAG: 50S ribosomal protein L17 [Candidatus Daviesbacteria bacterium]
MRHRVYGKHLGRDKNQRTALFRGLIRSLILNSSITTTQAKAKAVKGLIDRLIVKSKQNSPAAKSAVEKIIPQKEIVKKLMEEIAPSYSKRTSGFTQIVALGKRQGDNAMMVKMSLMESDRSRPEADRPLDEEKSDKPENQKVSESVDQKVSEPEKGKEEEKKPTRRKRSKNGNK